MNIQSHLIHPRALLALANAAALTLFLTLYNASPAFAAGAVGGTGGGGGGGGGGGQAPKVVESVKENGIAIVVALGTLAIAAFTLPPLIEALRKRQAGAILGTLALSGVVAFFVLAPESAMTTLKGLGSEVVK